MGLHEADSEIIDSEVNIVRQPIYRVTRLYLIPFSYRKARWPIGSGYSSTIEVFLVATRERVVSQSAIAIEGQFKDLIIRRFETV